MGSNSDLALAICKTMEIVRLPPDPNGVTTAARTKTTTNGRATRNTQPPTLGRRSPSRSSLNVYLILNYDSQLIRKSTAPCWSYPDYRRYSLRHPDFCQETGTQTIRQDRPIPIGAVSRVSFVNDRTQSGGTTSGPARLSREDQKVVSRKRAPCGSSTSTMRPNVKSKGSTMTVPPRSRTRRAAASASSTPK